MGIWRHHLSPVLHQKCRPIVKFCPPCSQCESTSNIPYDEIPEYIKNVYNILLHFPSSLEKSVYMYCKYIYRYSVGLCLTPTWRSDGPKLPYTWLSPAPPVTMQDVHYRYGLTRTRIRYSLLFVITDAAFLALTLVPIGCTVVVLYKGTFLSLDNQALLPSFSSGISLITCVHVIPDVEWLVGSSGGNCGWTGGGHAGLCHWAHVDFGGCCWCFRLRFQVGTVDLPV